MKENRLLSKPKIGFYKDSARTENTVYMSETEHEQPAQRNSGQM
jgi:hypothetical protein